MLPVMLYARKLDSEDPQVVLYLRVAYGVVQVCMIVLILICMQKVSSKAADTTAVYTEKAKGFMDDPNAPKKYIKSTRGACYSSKMTEFRNSTVMGICMTVGLHYYKGMVMGLCMQCVMAPFNAYENKIVKFALFGAEDMGEKLEADLTKDDLIIELLPDGTENVLGKGKAKPQPSRTRKRMTPRRRTRSLASPPLRSSSSTLGTRPARLTSPLFSLSSP